MKVRNHPDGNRDVLGAPSVQSDTVGKGAVTIYRDGKKITGHVETNQGVRTAALYRQVRRPIPLLNPARTWVALTG
jgi:hypothetical protein